MRQLEEWYWNVVQACLREFHGFSEEQAGRSVHRLRDELAAAPTPLQAVPSMIYHQEPFFTSCELAGSDRKEIGELAARYGEIKQRPLPDRAPDSGWQNALFGAFATGPQTEPYISGAGLAMATGMLGSQYAELSSLDEVSREMAGKPLGFQQTFKVATMLAGATVVPGGVQITIHGTPEGASGYTITELEALKHIQQQQGY